MRRFEFIDVFKSNLLSFFVMFLGVVTFIISVLMIVSVVLIPVGILGIFVSLVMCAVATPKTEYKCHECDYVDKVDFNTKIKRCEKCDIATEFKWE